MQTENSTRIRLSILTLAICIVLGLIGLVLRVPVPLPNMDLDTWAQVVTGSNYFLAQILTIFAYIFPYFGFWALYAYLARIKQVERIAFWGFMSSSQSL